MTLTVATSAQLSQPQDVPAYHPAAPKPGEKMPPLLSSRQLTGPSFTHPAQANAYRVAAKVQRVIYQLPCYCYCDRAAGHKSLHSCFESEHGAHCSTCMKEAYFAYMETKKGKSVKQIREEIIKGDFEKVDLETAASLK